MSDQQPRFLAKTAGYGRTPSGPDHLEALDDDELARQVEQARKKVLDERIRRREATSEEMQRELDHVDARGRYLRRELKRLARGVR